MIETGEDLKRARVKLGWSAGTMIRALRLEIGETDADFERARKHYREIEGGGRRLTGPIAVAVEGFLEGHRPEGFDEHMG